MEKRQLGKTELVVSVIGFGGIPLQGLEKKKTEQLLRLAVEQGINFFDTARGYTDSEAKIGLALSNVRDKCLLATKSMARDAESMTKDIDKSLKLLSTDVIDLYQIHNPDTLDQLKLVLGPGGAYESLARAVRVGKVRYVGITGHSSEILKEAVESKLFDTVQHPFNPLETAWQKDVIPAARAHSMGIIAMKPLAGGALQSAAAAFRFSLDEGGVDVVIPGMDQTEQVKENAAVGERLIPPTKEDFALIARAREQWQGTFCRRCGYCLPCANGLKIPFLFLLEAYYTRYGLKDWALERLDGLEKSYTDCQRCGECVERCPYHLPIPDLMESAARTVKVGS